MDSIPVFDKPARMKLSGHDQCVMATSQDALCTKVYASGLNYMDDDYSKLFLKSKRKMYPIINRGTWARVQAFREHVLKFLNAFANSDKPRIVVNLGAGYDTTFFWLNDKYPQLAQNMVWIDIDYDQVVEKKTQVIRKTESLNQRLVNDQSPTCDFQINSENYKLLSCDIR